MVFMTSEVRLLLFAADAGEGPRFVTRPGAPDEADLRQALDLLSVRRVQLGGTEEQATDQKDEEGAAKIPAASREPPQSLMHNAMETNVVHYGHRVPPLSPSNINIPLL